MEDPKTYVASAVGTEVIVQPPQQPKPKIEGDPLNAFENFHFQVQADLRAWMTHTAEERDEAVKEYGLISDKKAEELKLNPVRMHKILNYIIWLEATHPFGQRDVAARAFNLLFPKAPAKADA